MKLRAVIAGLVLGIATLAFAQHHQIHSSASSIPIPLCPPDQPDCTLNK